jgi:hypothetical protein
MASLYHSIKDEDFNKFTEYRQWEVSKDVVRSQLSVFQTKTLI